MSLLQGRFLTFHAFEQFIQLDRLLVVVGNPGTQGLDHVLFVGAPREHDRFEHPVFAADALQLLHQLDAIHVRHMQVAQHQTDFGVFTETLDRLSAGFTRHTAVPAAFEKLAQFFDDQRLIIDHEHFYRRRKLVHEPLHCSGQS